jgi:hypothetical protein
MTGRLSVLLALPAGALIAETRLEPEFVGLP